MSLMVMHNRCVCHPRGLEPPRSLEAKNKNNTKRKPTQSLPNPKSPVCFIVFKKVGVRFGVLSTVWTFLSSLVPLPHRSQSLSTMCFPALGGPTRVLFTSVEQIQINISFSPSLQLVVGQPGCFCGLSKTLRFFRTA